MLFTQMNLIYTSKLLKAMGYRNIKIRYTEPPWVAEITISGFGRFQRLEPMAVIMFRRDKQLPEAVRIVRKFFGFQLWEIGI